VAKVAQGVDPDEDADVGREARGDGQLEHARRVLQLAEQEMAEPHLQERHRAAHALSRGKSGESAPSVLHGGQPIPTNRGEMGLERIGPGVHVDVSDRFGLRAGKQAKALGGVEAAGDEE